MPSSARMKEHSSLNVFGVFLVVCSLCFIHASFLNVPTRFLKMAWMYRLLLSFAL